MPKVTNEVKAQKIALAKRMRGDDVGWDAIARHADINMPVETLRKWLEGGDDTKPRPKPKRGAKVDDAAIIKDLRAENARLQALCTDILLGKVKLQRT